MFLEIFRMADKRKTDLAPQTWFRSGRFFRDGGKWFFNTREGTLEGPYAELADAENGLLEYIRIMNSGFMPRDSKLELEPLEIKD
jgi:hypothetical protein